MPGMFIFGFKYLPYGSRWFNLGKINQEVGTKFWIGEYNPELNSSRISDLSDKNEALDLEKAAAAAVEAAEASARGWIIMHRSARA